MLFVCYWVVRHNLLSVLCKKKFLVKYAKTNCLLIFKKGFHQIKVLLFNQHTEKEKQKRRRPQTLLSEFNKYLKITEFFLTKLGQVWNLNF